MQVDLGYIYPDYEVLITLSQEDLEEIIAKGSLEDRHIDMLMEAIKMLHIHCKP